MAVAERPSLSQRSRVPAVGGSRPLTMRRNVDLPQPDGPTRQTNSPSVTVRSSGPRACTRFLPEVNCRSIPDAISFRLEAAGRGDPVTGAARVWVFTVVQVSSGTGGAGWLGPG